MRVESRMKVGIRSEGVVRDGREKGQGREGRSGRGGSD